MTFTNRSVLSPQERRERNREEMTTAILDAAREIMRAEGAGALNLNVLARRVSLTTPALYSYFPNKHAIYDALYQTGIEMLQEREETIWQEYGPDWERLRAWFQARISFAMEHPDLYHLIFSAPVPGFIPSESSIAETQRHLSKAVQGLKEIIDAGVIAPNIPPDRAIDFLLATRHGIVAEQIGKASVVPADSGRFDHLVNDTINVLQLAWAPDSAEPGGKGGAPV